MMHQQQPPQQQQQPPQQQQTQQPQHTPQQQQSYMMPMGNHMPHGQMRPFDDSMPSNSMMWPNVPQQMMQASMHSMQMQPQLMPQNQPQRSQQPLGGQPPMQQNMSLMGSLGPAPQNRGHGKSTLPPQPPPQEAAPGSSPQMMPIPSPPQMMANQLMSSQHSSGGMPPLPPSQHSSGPSLNPMSPLIPTGSGSSMSCSQPLGSQSQMMMHGQQPGNQMFGQQQPPLMNMMNPLMPMSSFYHQMPQQLYPIPFDEPEAVAGSREDKRGTQPKQVRSVRRDQPAIEELRLEHEPHRSFHGHPSGKPQERESWADVTDNHLPVQDFFIDSADGSLSSGMMDDHRLQMPSLGGDMSKGLAKGGGGGKDGSFRMDIGMDDRRLRQNLVENAAGRGPKGVGAPGDRMLQEPDHMKGKSKGKGKSKERDMMMIQTPLDQGKGKRGKEMDMVMDDPKGKGKSKGKREFFDHGNRGMKGGKQSSKSFGDGKGSKDSMGKESPIAMSKGRKGDGKYNNADNCDGLPPQGPGKGANQNQKGKGSKKGKSGGEQEWMKVIAGGKTAKNDGKGHRQAQQHQQQPPQPPHPHPPPQQQQQGRRDDVQKGSKKGVKG